MPRIPVHTTDDAPQASRAALSALESEYGKVLNIHGEIAHSPAVLLPYVAVQDVIGEHALLDHGVREAIALAVGNQDECTYCQSAHTGEGKAAGLSDGQMIAIRRGEVDDDPALAALLTLAQEYTAGVGHHQRRRLAERQGRRLDLTELSAQVTLNLLTNYFNHHVHTELDVPEAPSTYGPMPQRDRPVPRVGRRARPRQHRNRRRSGVGDRVPGSILHGRPATPTSTGRRRSQAALTGVPLPTRQGAP